MAYILAYMMFSMSAVPGINITGVLVCTALVTAISCIAMGVYSNTPICLAPVLVIPGLIAGWITNGETTYEQAFGLVLISGVLFLIISLLKLRDLFARAPLQEHKDWFGCYSWLPDRALVSIPAVFTRMFLKRGYVFGDFSQKSTLLGLIGVIICFILTYVKFNIGGRLYKIKGGFYLLALF